MRSTHPLTTIAIAIAAGAGKPLQLTMAGGGKGTFDVVAGRHHVWFDATL
jgi:hypothetical protein